MRVRSLLLALAIGLLAATPALAGHHQWDLAEAYSSPTGAVQFVELIGNANNEQALLNWTVTSGTATFTFNTLKSECLIKSRLEYHPPNGVLLGNPSELTPSKAGYVFSIREILLITEIGPYSPSSRIINSAVDDA